jgi:hypothetical protein
MEAPRIDIAEVGLKTVDAPISKLHQVPNGGFKVSGAPHDPPADWTLGKKEAKDALEDIVKVIEDYQSQLHADSRWSVLCGTLCYEH